MQLFFFKKSSKINRDLLYFHLNYFSLYSFEYSIMKKVIIIGNGISGITAARWIRKLSNFEILVISDESEYFFSRTALMYVSMGHMNWRDIEPYERTFWKENRIDLLQQKVKEINHLEKTITLHNAQTLAYDELIIATGSKINYFNWPGQNAKGVFGLYNKQDLEYINSLPKDNLRIAIVGGGLIGVELAEMMVVQGRKVSMIIRENSYWRNVLPKEESELITAHLREHHIDLNFGKSLAEILSNEKQEVRGIKLLSEEIIDCNYVGICTGVSPNIEWLEQSELKRNKGILVDQFLQTNLPNIYAIGDCAELISPDKNRKSIEAVWYTGRMMGETVAQTICVTKTEYKPGIWFNSAKFFDIEYQVYGNVPSEINYPLDSKIWIHPQEKKSVRIVFQADTKIVVGFNLIGIRFRHEICDQWIASNATLEFVTQNLHLALFDGEFSHSLKRMIQ